MPEPLSPPRPDAPSAAMLPLPRTGGLLPEQIRGAACVWCKAELDNGTAVDLGDAVGFLQAAGEMFDAVYSVYGAAWFADPDLLMPAVHERLRPGGRLVFSQRPPVEGCYGCQASYIPRGVDEDPLVVKRWDYAPSTWKRLLAEYGYRDVRTVVVPAPPGPREVGTLIVVARA
ncbi:hypothetical protein [Streptomyces sp. NPDC003697]